LQNLLERARVLVETLLELRLALALPEANSGSPGTGRHPGVRFAEITLDAGLRAAWNGNCTTPLLQTAREKGELMLHVTSAARAELHDMLVRVLAQRSDPDPPDLGLRLVAEKCQLGLALDEPREGDQVVGQEGRSVLIIDPSTSELVEDRTLDVIETPQGTRLGLVNGE
jgi:hypothetical protein